MKLAFPFCMQNFDTTSWAFAASLGLMATLWVSCGVQTPETDAADPTKGLGEALSADHPYVSTVFALSYMRPNTPERTTKAYFNRKDWWDGIRACYGKKPGETPRAEYRREEWGAKPLCIRWPACSGSIVDDSRLADKSFGLTAAHCFFAFYPPETAEQPKSHSWVDEASGLQRGFVSHVDGTSPQGDKVWSRPFLEIVFGTDAELPAAKRFAVSKAVIHGDSAPVYDSPGNDVAVLTWGENENSAFKGYPIFQGTLADLFSSQSTSSAATPFSDEELWNMWSSLIFSEENPDPQRRNLGSYEGIDFARLQTFPTAQHAGFGISNSYEQPQPRGGGIQVEVDRIRWLRARQLRVVGELNHPAGQVADYIPESWRSFWLEQTRNNGLNKTLLFFPVDPQGKSGLCYGDSGGPYYIEVGGKTQQLSLFSWFGPPCIAQETVGPFLSKYLPWIKNAVAELR